MDDNEQSRENETRVGCSGWRNTFPSVRGLAEREMRDALLLYSYYTYLYKYTYGSFAIRQAGGVYTISTQLHRADKSIRGLPARFSSKLFQLSER